MKHTLSIIIPVFNSEKSIKNLCEDLIIVLSSISIDYEIIFINDGSTDNSWSIINILAKNTSNVIAVDLLKNYGQHSAIFCGIGLAKGDYLITMDDDGQNPPSEIRKLYSKIMEGYDVVFARFTKKQHPLYRRVGTKIVDMLNKKIFEKPIHIELTNFRIFTKEVADRIISHKTYKPYIPGLLLLYSTKIANVETDHNKRIVGFSNYSFINIFQLVGRILFNYSIYPLNFIVIAGFAVSLISFLLGMYYIAQFIYIGVSVPGWTSVVVLLSFTSSIVMLILGVLGQYIVRLLQQVSFSTAFQIRSITNINNE